MIYLASPYTHKSPDVQASRASQAAYYVRHFFDAQRVVYSPVCHWHFVVQSAYKSDVAPQDFAAFRFQSLSMLDLADSLHIAQIDGWKESYGIEREYRHARNAGKEIVLCKLIDMGAQLEFNYDIGRTFA